VVALFLEDNAEGAKVLLGGHLIHAGVPLPPGRGFHGEEVGQEVGVGRLGPGRRLEPTVKRLGGLSQAKLFWVHPGFLDGDHRPATPRVSS
jgi:hypothetical protein